MYLLPLSGFTDSLAAGKNSNSDITFGTFNIHYISPSQKKMIWEDRRQAVVEALRSGKADIIGFQEMETFAGGHWNSENRQLEWVLQNFPEYAVTSFGDPRVYPATQPILYRRERFEALQQGFFFFSSTPEKIYSRPWRMRFPAFCSWSRLRDKATGNSFYVYNVHFDHSSLYNRLKAAELVAQRISSREHEEAVIVLGDFNAPKFFPPVRLVARAGLTVADTAGSTFHFNHGINLQPAIDHVLYSEGFIHKNTRVIRKKFAGSWPSDHYPVFVTLSTVSPQ